MSSHTKRLFCDTCGRRIGAAEMEPIVEDGEVKCWFCEEKEMDESFRETREMSRRLTSNLIDPFISGD